MTLIFLLHIWIIDIHKPDSAFIPEKHALLIHGEPLETFVEHRCVRIALLIEMGLKEHVTNLLIFLGDDWWSLQNSNVRFHKRLMNIAIDIFPSILDIDQFPIGLILKFFFDISYDSSKHLLSLASILQIQFLSY